ncbi:HAD family phosphatase [Rhodoferax sp. TBRC 17660]|uniref:HAD family phosphatase n=1 Tax=Rhodoferax potami TaxID=3068338 RepID=A0ABU3KKK5_9BURK|nr:HAD family phosphatase [Rhodoferax sp. TBRC 17660]MDT7518225.1 HAD family phosphatase [Rhodoferax sp. TBRC 17660]
MNVVFDFGAVLFTWRPVDLMMECFPQRAATRAEAGHLAHEVFGHHEWQAFDRGTIAMADVVAQVANRAGLDATVLGTLVESIGERLTPMPESVALFKSLVALSAQRAARGGEPLKLYYLSNMPVPYARTLERVNAFLQDFDGGIFSGDELLIKPEPAIYQCLQKRYALEPAKTVFLDDLLPNIQAAQAEGWHGIHFHTAQQAVQELQALGLSEISL